MREILFRGKRKDNDQWVQGSLFSECSRFEIVRSTCNNVGIEGVDVIPETVGQYTGLTDKNGKKIFEGDIVRNQYEKNRYQYFKIIYCNRTYCWLTENKYGMLGKLCNVIGDIEIIGNIHDNPELLGDE